MSSVPSAFSLLVLITLAACSGTDASVRPPGPMPPASPPATPPPAATPTSECPAARTRNHARRITFHLAAATVAPDSLPVVDSVAAPLRTWPALAVESQVHTDTVRAGAYNALQS